MNYHGIEIDQEMISQFCQRHYIRKLAFFGSILRNDFRPDSDVDILVEFESGKVPGLAFFSLEDEISNIIGRRVDLHTPGFLSPYFREEVLKEAEIQYVSSPG